MSPVMEPRVTLNNYAKLKLMSRGTLGKVLSYVKLQVCSEIVIISVPVAVHHILFLTGHCE
jgi:hypothetical protein